MSNRKAKRAQVAAVKAGIPGEAPGTGSATADAALCHWQIGLVQ